MGITQRRRLWITLLVTLLLVADQALKIWVKTHMTLGESIPLLGQWFRLTFVENEGMAFGWLLGGATGKIVLSLFRLVLVGFLIYYINKLIKRPQVPCGVLIGLALVLMGALGNIIDSAFYGLIFSESTLSQTAVFLPEGGGYAPFLKGKVVDMFFAPMAEWTWPASWPWVGGKEALFFRYIFNVADAAISVAVVYLVLFHYHFFAPKENKK